MVADSSGALLNATGWHRAGRLRATVDRYLDLPGRPGLIRRLQPWRLCQTGDRSRRKVLVREPDLLHALLGLETLDDVLRALGPWAEL